MLAVLPPWRGRGVGLALKLAQRAGALDQGIEEIRWTYDPLLGANARFNLNRLRAVATAYFPDFYGDMPDKLNRGDRSDRFEVTWWLRSPQVDDALHRKELIVPAVLYPSLLDAEGPPDAPQPKETGLAVDGPVTVQIPADYQRLRQQNPALAEAWRQASGRVFAECFKQGLEAELIMQGRYWFSARVPRPSPPPR
jgi:predicted GNAT superfamily acetyltransferase